MGKGLNKKYIIKNYVYKSLIFMFIYRDIFII